MSLYVCCVYVLFVCVCLLHSSFPLVLVLVLVLVLPLLLLLNRLGELEQATAAFSQAAALDPLFWEAIIGQGNIYLPLREHREACK